MRIGPEVGRDSVCCPHCEGTGTEPCIRCEGSGKRPDTRYDVETGKYVRNLTNLEVCNMKNEYADDELGKDTHLKDAVDSTEASSDADIRNDVDVSVDVVRL